MGLWGASILQARVQHQQCDLYVCIGACTAETVFLHRCARLFGICFASRVNTPFNVQMCVFSHMQVLCVATRERLTYFICILSEWTSEFKKSLFFNQQRSSIDLYSYIQGWCCLGATDHFHGLCYSLNNWAKINIPWVSLSILSFRVGLGVTKLFPVLPPIRITSFMHLWLTQTYN